VQACFCFGLAAALQPVQHDSKTGQKRCEKTEKPVGNTGLFSPLPKRKNAGKIEIELEIEIEIELELETEDNCVINKYLSARV
jgi:hypothetical protein